MTTARIHMDITVKEKLLQEFLQHLRNFDAQHFSDIHFALGIETYEMTSDELEKILKSIKPPFPLFAKGNTENH